MHMGRIGSISLLFLLTMLLTFSCRKKECYEVDYKYSYFPLDSGHTVVYDVDSINVNDFTDPPTIDTFTFQVMEVIGDTFIDLEGDLAYEIFRYKRKDTTMGWGSPRLWWAKRDITNLQKIEENVRYIKLTFPPSLNDVWQGNSFVVIDDGNEYLEGWEYSYTEIDVPKVINGLSFDSTLTVLHVDEETLINKTFSTESYAKNVGMIYKELVYLNSQRVELGFDWDNPEKWDENGFILRMRINSYSN